MRVLVTGAGGFVGGHLVPALSLEGHEVIAVSQSPFDSPGATETDAFDMMDFEALSKTLEKYSPQGIIHLAGQASVPRSWEDPSGTYEVNLIGTSNLLRAIEDRDTRVLLIGSAQEYGPGKPGRPMLESDELSPRSPYALSKMFQELLGSMYFHKQQMPVVMARPFNHTGPGQSSDYVVGAFCAQLVQLEQTGGHPVLNVGNLDPIRDLLDVRDVVDAYRLLIESGTPGEIYNVSSGTGIQIREVLRILLEASTLPDGAQIVDETTDRAGDADWLVGDNSKVRDHIGWSPQIPIEKSLFDTLTWYRSVSHQERSI